MQAYIEADHHTHDVCYIRDDTRAACLHLTCYDHLACYLLQTVIDWPVFDISLLA
jgi:hypothetical protein